MLTIFTCPKPFDRHHNIIQRNAIRSWMVLKPKPEIILTGDELGTEEICKEFDLIHIPDVKRNEFGAPLVNSVFKKAEKIASNDTMCYVNADIILMSDFINAIKLIDKNKTNYFLVGQRWDADIKESLAFEDHWQENLYKYIKEKGKLHAVTGKDFFVFPRGFFNNIPPFAIGRGAWDDWLVFQARKQKSAVIDITNSVTIIHQNHDYSHVKNQEKGNWYGEEAKRNKLLAGKSFFGEKRYTIDDANYVIMRNEIVKKSQTYLFYRLIRNFLSPYYMFFKKIFRYRY